MARSPDRFPLLELLPRLARVRVFDLLVDHERGFGVLDGTLAVTESVKRQACVPERVAFAPPISRLIVKLCSWYSMARRVSPNAAA